MSDNAAAQATRKGLAQVRRAPPGVRPDGAPCTHPPARLWAWFVDSPGGQVLCVACCACGAVLAGGATLHDDDHDESEGGQQ